MKDAQLISSKAKNLTQSAVLTRSDAHHCNVTGKINND